MTDKRAYFKVDVGYFSNPKIAAVMAQSPMAVLLHLESVAYAAQHLTDGSVVRALVLRIVGASESDADLLLEEGLWLPGDRKGRVIVHDYLLHQRSSDEAKSASRKAQAAANRRWADATEHATEHQPSMPREKEREKEQTDASFDAWWAIYPKKVGKGQALKAYRTAVKKTTPDNLAASLQKQLPWFAAQVKPDGDFRPNGSSWLNGERWGDELHTPAASNDAWARASRVRQ